VIPRRREKPAVRALIIGAATAAAFGIAVGGLPSLAMAADDPAPVQTTVTPTPSDDPIPSAVAPIESALPPVVLQARPSTPLPAGAIVGFERVYPTSPWIYTAEPGTRFLDARDPLGNVLRHHLGIDAQGGVRQPIFAAAAGTVIGGTWGTTTGDGHGFGNQVEIAHSQGYATRYAHLAEPPLVHTGDQVVTGQLIGFMGGSQNGNLAGVERHLHFEVTKAGKHIDPVLFLSGADESQAFIEDEGSLGSPLNEIRPAGNDSFVSTPTGLLLNTAVFTAVAMGGDSAQIMASEGGKLKQLAMVDGLWTKTDTQLPLNATSLSGADTGTGSPELLAVEEGKLFHIVGDASGWTKTWTGHYFSGTVSAARLPGNQLHAMLQQSGYLYYLSPAQGGLWNVADTRLKVGELVDAAYVGGAAPDAITVVDGQIQHIARVDRRWVMRSTGLPASASIAAVYQGGSWPVALTAETNAIGLTRVVDGIWMRNVYDVTVPSPIDAAVATTGTVIYSIG